MFFPRLRRNAKWVFLFLALAFALGFVGFGVGAGGVGVGDIFRGTGGASGVPSISDAEKRTLANPKDAKAFRDLATAHQAAGNTDEAIQALESPVSLRPRDGDALRQLAAQYLQKLDEAQQRTRIAQLREAYLAPGVAVASAFSSARRRSIRTRSRAPSRAPSRRRARRRTQTPSRRRRSTSTPTGDLRRPTRRTRAFSSSTHSRRNRWVTAPQPSLDIGPSCRSRTSIPRREPTSGVG